MSNKEAWARLKVRQLMKEQQIYHPKDLFAFLYPHYDGHYSRLRQIIAEEKNNA